MKVRGLAEWTNYLFFIVGIIAILVLPYTVNTYLSYAEEGYGVEVEMKNVTTGLYNWVDVLFTFENPGQFDIEVVNNATLTFTDEAGNVHNLTKPVSILLDSKEITLFNFGFESVDQDLYDVLESGLWALEARFTLYISERDAYVPLHFSYSEGVGQDV